MRGRIRRHFRHVLKDGTCEKEWYLIPYGRCRNEGCRRYFRILPEDMGVPFKHYDKDAIADVLDEKITPESGVDSPAVLTMLRWIRWLAINSSRIEGVLRSVGYRLLGYGEEILFSPESLLDRIRRDRAQWLPAMLRTVYNSGHRLMPC